MKRKPIIYFVFWFVSCFTTLSVLVSTAVAEDSDIKNVFIDETVSYDGHEFFRIFRETFYAPNQEPFTTLVVKEFPDVKSGNRIQIVYEYTTMYEATIYRGSKYVERSAWRAANVTKNKMKFWKKNKGNIDPDLALSEL
ncbi:MAG: CsgE family curli-type amyloid fiber assembly protein [Ghiorsea sp.]